MAMSGKRTVKRRCCKFNMTVIRSWMFEFPGLSFICLSHTVVIRANVSSVSLKCLFIDVHVIHPIH